MCKKWWRTQVKYVTHTKDAKLSQDNLDGKSIIYDILTSKN